MVVDIHYFYASGASCLISLIIYKFISPIFSCNLCPAYNMLQPEQQIDWNTRTVSSLHSLIVGLVSIYVIFSDNQLAEDPCMHNAVLVRWNCAIVAGYMISDLLILSSNWKLVGDRCYVFHHAATVIAYIVVVAHGRALWFANFRLMSEMSTPFVNQRWFLDTLCYPKTSPVLLANAAALFFTFFLVRIVAVPPFWLKVYAVYDSPQYHQLGYIKFVLFVVPLVLDIINIYWFAKILRGAGRLVRAKLKEVGGESVPDFKLT